MCVDQMLILVSLSGGGGGVSGSALEGAVRQDALRKLLLCLLEAGARATVVRMNLNVTTVTIRQYTNRLLTNTVS